ncbi:Membrane associated serine protease, rhomboid family [Chishuiella changwenlii]|uniref:Membrane associated serine protease, rhomboid family n=1 Tax=Chishuiella changwenlii TaxID=1434701 RepID=A0A1M7A3C8_9FLAO|nr:rhomboid family intramembrane serine protease [Chishuiella changwenlii]GGE91755.1 rhomboid family intramembrane serine protease [Chishuiella changwenlii]SHL37214.1 Membrane associated serine protease, rhomboid family [Chishuiella changwenlii]
MGDISIVTLIIIGINVLVSWKGFNDYSFFDKYKFQVGSILHNKEYHRILSSGFLHVDLTHLLFNMLTLFFFANSVITFFASPEGFLFGDFSNAKINVGYGMFLLIFLASIVGGNLLSLLVHKKDNWYSAVGASGGVSGVLFAAIAAFPEQEIGLYFIIDVPAWAFAILYLGYSVYGMKTNLGNIGHSAHLGGAIVGMLSTILFYPALLQLNTYYILGMVVPLIILFVMILRDNRNRK